MFHLASVCFQHFLKQYPVESYTNRRDCIFVSVFSFLAKMKMLIFPFAFLFFWAVAPSTLIWHLLGTKPIFSARRGEIGRKYLRGW